jgi:hypothetical protein
MEYDKQLIKVLYRRSGGVCECTVKDCKVHKGRRRCTNALYADAWKPFKPVKRSSDSMRNLIAVCPDCFKELDIPRLL